MQRFSGDKEWSEEHLRSFIWNVGGTPADLLDDKEFSQQCLSRLMADMRILLHDNMYVTEICAF